MNRSILVVAIAAALWAPAVDAQYKVPWSTIDSGGAAASAPTWSLRGSHGQPDAGDQNAGGTFDLLGGFWPGVRHLRSSMIFGDGFEMGNTSAWSSTQPLHRDERAPEAGTGSERAERK
jgi:hypothetical protein